MAKIPALQKLTHIYCAYKTPKIVTNSLVLLDFSQNIRCMKSFPEILSCIDTVVVVLSDWRDTAVHWTGAVRNENLKYFWLQIWPQGGATGIVI